MTKYYTLVFIAFYCFQTQVAQNTIVNIPDENFKNYLLDRSSINTNGDNEIQVSEAAEFTGRIDVKGSGKLDSQKVRDLTGLETFTALTELNCEYNELTSIDVSKNIGLLSLECSNNNITSLNVTQNTKLEALECFNNQISTLDVSQNVQLIKLWCSTNLLSSLDITKNTRLRLFEAESNSLTNLDVSQNTQLTTINISKNNFTAIDISNNRDLLTFYARANDLKAIDFSTNFKLDDIVLVGNDLTTIDMSKRSNTTRLLADFNANLTCIKIKEGFTPPNCSTTRRNGWCVPENTVFSTTCGTASINDIEFYNTIAIFPNPISDVLHVNSNGNETIKNIKIYNSLGKLILTEQQSNINTSFLPKGMYLLKIESTSRKIAIKSIIK